MTTLAFAADALPADLVRDHLADQLEPVVRLRQDLARRLRPGIDLAEARARLDGGHLAYDPLEAIGSAGNLLVPFVQATVAIERAGLATSQDAGLARERRYELLPLIAGWLSAEPTPRDRAKAAARRAPALVAGAILSATSAAVLEGRPLPHNPATTCPCCGCAPDFAWAAEGARVLVCARCDAKWETTHAGCMGCGATLAPAIAHVESPLLGYRLTMCNPCGRYMKEPTMLPARFDPVIERALTAQLDAAAESRGLRL